MEYSALTIGLADELFSSIQTLLTPSHLRFTPSLTVQDASRLLIQQVFHLLIVDLEYLRSIQQIDWLLQNWMRLYRDFMKMYVVKGEDNTSPNTT